MFGVPPQQPAPLTGQTGGMDRATALDAVDLESSRFLVAASHAASFDTGVPSCPEWDVAQLIGHLGFIYGRVALVVSTRRTAAIDRSEVPAAPEGQARLGWFAERRMAMLSTLDVADADVPVWNWTVNSPGPTSFWFRRMAHESLVHRVDMELAQGSEPVEGDPEVAADTVAEFFEIFYPMFEPQISETGLGGSMHLHATDVSGAEWTVEALSGGSKISREHAKADVALRGSAFDLACWIWGRLPTGRLETFGDRTIANRFQELVRA